MKKSWDISNKSMVMFKYSFIIAVLIGLVVFFASVLAAHTSSATIEPEFAAINSDITYTITVKNEQGDDINRVKIDIPVGYSNLQCNEVEGWNVDVSTSTYCIYVAYGGNAINESNSKNFSVDVTTSPNECYHTWSIYTVDIKDDTYRNDVDTKIDATPPVVNAYIGEPKINCTEIDDPECDYWITQDTEIDLSCINRGPHPSPLDKLQWRIKVDDGNWSDWNETQAGIDGMDVTIKFIEDSLHYLQYKCNDTVGEESKIYNKIFKVDSTPPVTTKEIIGPQFFNETEGKLYIDSKTNISLTCVDEKEPCAIGKDNIQYKYRVCDSPCTGGWTDWFVYNETTMIQFPEESHHELEYYCNDTLGNEEEHHFQEYYVDKRSPETIKWYEGPQHPKEDVIPKWINSETLVHLESSDGDEEHASGVKATFYKNVWPVDERYCWYEYECMSWIPNEPEDPDWTLYEEPFNKTEESCHIIEYYSVDNVDKVEPIDWQCVFVDNTPPNGTKKINGPKTKWYGDERYPEWVGICGYTMDCWKIAIPTPIYLNCTDQEPHPVYGEKVCYKVTLDGKDVTDGYCEDLTDGWCCVDSPETIVFLEDTVHQLDFYCEDGLGNKGLTDSEIFKVEGGYFNITLLEKWNLVSVPFVLLNDDPEEVFEDIANDIESVWTYDGETDEWYVYTPDGIENDNLDHITPGWGYWVKAENDTVLVIAGSLMSPATTPPSRDLIKGWNLIGYYGISSPGPVEVYDGPDGEGGRAICALYSLRYETVIPSPNWNALYTFWDHEDYWFDRCDKLDPGAGYWIEMDEADKYSPSSACWEEFWDEVCPD